MCQVVFGYPILIIVVVSFLPHSNKLLLVHRSLTDSEALSGGGLLGQSDCRFISLRDSNLLFSSVKLNVTVG